MPQKKHDNQKLQRALIEDRKRQCTEQDSNPSPVKTRRSSINLSTPSTSDQNDNADDDSEATTPCFICNEIGEKRFGRHRAETLGITRKVYEAAKTLCDTESLAKLSAGDMIAIDAVYHLRCLNRLYKKAEAIKDGTSKFNDGEKLKQQQAFVELLEYIESFRGTREVLAMGQICKIYEDRLVELGITVAPHTTRLRKSLIEAIPDLECIKNKNGYNWDLVFNEYLGLAVSEMKQRDSFKDKVLRMAQTASDIRESIFKSRDKNKPISDSVIDIPEEIKVFLGFLLNGPYVKPYNDPNMKATEKVISSIGQVIAFNTVKKRKASKDFIRHDKKIETAFPLYMGIKTYLVSGKGLMNKLSESGLSASYRRVKQFATDIANTCIAKWKDEGVVLPPNAKKGVFTVLGFDNVDWNARNPTAKAMSTLHGTIFIVHQFVHSNEPYVLFEIPKEQQGKQSVSELPEFYSKVDYSYSLDSTDKYVI